MRRAWDAVGSTMSKNRKMPWSGTGKLTVSRSVTVRSPSAATRKWAW